jgi:hypothetical protein
VPGRSLANLACFSIASSFIFSFFLNRIINLQEKENFKLKSNIESIEYPNQIKNLRINKAKKREQG